MKNKGFTLIELLAVIVILGVIALIAVPIIIGIVNDSIDETNKRSIDMYASAVENAVITYQLSEQKKPTSIEEVENYISYKGSEVICATRKLYSNGTIYLGSCTVDGKEVDYEYGKAPACTVVKQDTTEYSVGDEVSCKIGENTEKFYVIKRAALTTTSLSMLTEKNINTTTYRQSDNAGTVAFSSTNYWASTTNNYPANVYNNNSNLYQYISEYEKYLNENGLNAASATLITPGQLSLLGCVSYEFNCMDAPRWVYSTNYWTSVAYDTDMVWFVSDGYFGREPYVRNFGVRPVITISTNDIK